jgi:methyl-accepting chemotaxis protein
MRKFCHAARGWRAGPVCRNRDAAKAYAAAARCAEQINAGSTDLHTAQQTFTDAFDAFQQVQDKLGLQMQDDIAADGDASRWLMDAGLG